MDRIKFLFLVLFTIALHAEHMVLLSVTAIHAEDTDEYGNPFNENNYGIGYRYYDFKENDFFMSYTIIGLNDSHNNNMYTSTVGFNYNVLPYLDLGIETGLTSKVTAKYDGSSNREIIPMVVPIVRLIYEKMSLNLTYIPYMSYKDSRTYETTYVTIGYTF